jgi:multicomponent Na+:H+ antiporter subunit D
MAEAPLTMVAPLLIVAGGLVVMGVYTGDIVTHIIEPIIPPAIGN